MFKFLALLGVAFAKPQGLPECIADIEQLVQDGEAIIADAKAGNTTAAIAEIEAIVALIGKAETDCKQSANGLPECIADITQLVQDAELVISDVKAGNETKALTDIVILNATIEKAISDCKQSEELTWMRSRVANLKGLPECIADIEQLVQDGEAIIAEAKAGNAPAAIADIAAIVVLIEKAETDCKQSGYKKSMWIEKRVANLKDLPTCIADIETLVQDGEQIIADYKAKNVTDAIAEIEAIVALIEKAKTDCAQSGYKKSMWIQKRAANLKDLPTCIADLETLVTDGEQIIADFKSGNLTAAIAEIEAVVGAITKAKTDCTAAQITLKQQPQVGGMLKCIADIESLLTDGKQIIADYKAGNYTAAIAEIEVIVPIVEDALTNCKNLSSRLGDDPRKEYFEKEGARFAAGFMAGTNVGHFDEIDLYECLQNEPKALGIFYKADETLKESWIKKDSTEAVKALGEMVYFLVEMIQEPYPGTRHVHCTTLDNSKSNFTELRTVISELKDRETTLMAHDNTLMFNKQNITKEGDEMIEDYLKGNFMYLGYRFGKALADHSGAPPAPPSTQIAVTADPRKDYFEKMGARFAAGFMAGTNVGHFDDIDLYECIKLEPRALGIFYKADETLKESFIKKDSTEAIKALDEMVEFIVEMIMEPYPGTHHKVCAAIDNSKSQFDDLKLVLAELRNKDTTLYVSGDKKLMFNKMDITKEGGEMVDDYIKGQFLYLGWRFGHTLDGASKPTPPPVFKFLQ